MNVDGEPSTLPGWMNHPTPPLPVDLPSRLGPYRVEAHLGSGGMGEVFRGYDDHLTRAVAIKWVRPAALGSDDPEVARRRFRREARAAARINHPSIVQIYHVLELQEGGDAIAMELVEGQSIAEELRDCRSLAPQRTVEIALQIAQGLAEAHRQGVIHRDLKPANVMLTTGGQVKILDFGLATGRGVGMDSDRLTRPGEAVGSYDTMSPEQAEGKSVDLRSDLFSLGILMYLMVTGRRPFWGDTPLATVAQICREPHPDLRPLVPDAPIDLIDLIDLLLEKNPHNRPQSTDEVVRALEKVADQFTSLRIPLPATGPALRTLVLVDMVDREELWERLGERRAGKWVARLDQLLTDRLDDLPISERVELAEGSLLLLEKPIDAVHLATEIHRSLKVWHEEDATPPTPPVQAFVVIHFGEVQLGQDGRSQQEAEAADLGGAALLTSRLSDRAQPGQTLLTRSAFDLSRNAAGQSPHGAPLEWRAHGQFDVGGETIDLFETGEPGIAPFLPPGQPLAGDEPAGSKTILGWRPAAGQTLESHPGWRLTEQMGAGGFGEVWLAEHFETGERRVFKFCFHRDRRRELQRELTLFQILKDQLGERDDIARILDWNFEDAPYFVESEYTEDGRLGDWIHRIGGCRHISLAQRLDIVAQVADALAAAHSVGVLHKDVNPGSILVQELPDGQLCVRLADFSIGMLTDDAEVDPEHFSVLDMSQDDGLKAGTGIYRAPEVLEGRAATIQADIYALGVLLYQMVIGDLNRALGSGWEREVEDELLRRDIAGSVDVHPERRFADAGRLAQRLRHLGLRRARAEEQRRTEAMAAVNAAQTAKDRQVRRAALTASIAVLLGILAGLFHYRSLNKERERYGALAQELEAEKHLHEDGDAFWVRLFAPGNPEELSVEQLLDRGTARARALSGRPRFKAEQLQTLGRAFIELGQSEKAQPLLEEAFWTWKTELGENAPRSLGAARLMAVSLARGGQIDRATDELGRLEQQANRPTAETPPASLRLELARIRLELAELLIAQSRFEAAGQALSKALPALRTGSERYPESDANRVCLGRALRIQGQVHLQQVELEKARNSLDEALALSRASAEDRLEPWPILTLISRVAKAQGRLNQAETALQEALELQRAFHGEGHLGLAANLTSLAEIYEASGRSQDGAALLTESHRILAHSLGEEHPQTLETLFRLGVLELKSGRLEAARSAMEKALQGAEVSLDVELLATARYRAGLGRLERIGRRPERAKPLLKRALAAFRELQAHDRPSRAEALQDMALLVKEENPDGALDRLREALRIRRLSLPEDHPLVLELKQQLNTVEGRAAG